MAVAASNAFGAGLPDPDELPVRTLWTVLFFAVIGWSAVGFHTLAQLMEQGLETRLQVIQEILASLAAGVMTFFGIYYLLEWPKMAAYIGDFVAAFGGAKYLDSIKDLFMDVLRSLASKIVKKPEGP